MVSLLLVLLIIDIAHERYYVRQQGRDLRTMRRRTLMVLLMRKGVVLVGVQSQYQYRRQLRDLV